MRWHIELNETGTPLRVEHVDEIERVVGQLADEGLSELEPGIDHAFAINVGVAVVVAGLDDADTDDDCWKCRQ